jgi:hypothetical protein
MLLFSSGVLLAGAIALVSWGNVYLDGVSAMIAGLSAGTFTVAYLAAREAKSLPHEYESLAISLVNNIPMFSGFWSPVMFSTFVIWVGYANSWLIAGAYTLGLISIILFWKGNGTHSP